MFLRFYKHAQIYEKNHNKTTLTQQNIIFI